MSLSSSNLHDSIPHNEIRLDRITIVALSDHVFGDLDGEAVILHLGTGVYYGLNSVGTRVWTLIQSPISASAIRDVLLAEYDVDAAVCEKELIALLNDLSDRGLIKMTTNGTS
jgi:hypothetical protein